MYRFYIAFAISICCLFACQEAQIGASSEASTSLVPDSLLTVADLPDQKPEDVLKQWYGLIDSNRYHLAKLISTGPMLDLIGDMADTYELSKRLDPTVLPINTKFLSIKCDTKEATATCNCKTEVDGVIQNEAYRLVRQDEHWIMEAKLKSGKPQNVTPSDNNKYDAVIENEPATKKKK